ncbi:MAG: molecular chaperone DnaK [Myxococcota bacterium]|nr:molecular chaperone DnaK [Myxococcota bacterium]
MIIGIDLGTTNSCVAYIEGGSPVIIPNAEGTRTTPSVVAVTEGGERLIGQVAKRQAITNPEHTVFAVKRLIGQKYDGDELQSYIARLPYQIAPAENRDAWIGLRGELMSPAQVSSFVLSHMKKVAEDYLGEEITEAVITVPAYFNDLQRQATKDAGRIAGLDVLRIINEPTAAALSYGLDRDQAERIVVYDLGGGTFDVSILELSDGVFEVRSTSGDTYLGGEDFDFRLIEHLLNDFYEREGIDLSQDKMALQRLKEAAEKAKHELSGALETEINLPFVCATEAGPKHLIQTVTRAQLEHLVEDLIERTIAPCELALADAGLGVHEIDAVLLVGGMTRMPRVQERVEQFFKQAPTRGLNPDEVVAAGAAIQGGVLDGDVEDVVLLDVTPLSLGVETQGGVMTHIIPKNTTIPFAGAQIFSTAIDNQPMVSVHVLQGERPLVKDNRSLARFDLLGLPPAPRGVPQIQVRFEINADGILSVSATELATGRKQQVEIRASGGLSENEIGRMIDEAQQHQQSDAERRQLVELRNQAQGLLYSTERSISDYSELLSPLDIEELQRDIELLRDTLDTNDLEELQLAFQNLEQSAYRISELIYQSAASAEGE